MFWLDKPIYLPFPGHQIFKLRAASINWRGKKNRGKELENFRCDSQTRAKRITQNANAVFSVVGSNDNIVIDHGQNVVTRRQNFTFAMASFSHSNANKLERTGVQGGGYHVTPLDAYKMSLKRAARSAQVNVNVNMSGFGDGIGIGIVLKGYAVVIPGPDRWQNLTLNSMLCFAFSICGGNFKLTNKVGR